MGHVITGRHGFQRLEFMEPLVVHFGFEVRADFEVGHLFFEDFSHESLVHFFEVELALAVGVLFQSHF